MVDTEFYIRRIEELSDDRLKELLQLNTEENAAIMQVAEREATKRGIDPNSIRVEKAVHQKLVTKEKKDEGVNWASILADIFSGLP